MERTIKGAVVAKWTSTQKYRDNWEKIFGKAEEARCEAESTAQAALEDVLETEALQPEAEASLGDSESAGGAGS